MACAHQVERLAVQVFVRVGADLTDDATPTERFFGIGFWLLRGSRPVLSLCRECCVEDSVHYRIVDGNILQPQLANRLTCGRHTDCVVRRKRGLERAHAYISAYNFRI